MADRYNTAYVSRLEPVTTVNSSNGAGSNCPRTTRRMTRREGCRRNVFVLVRAVSECDFFQRPRRMARARQFARRIRRMREVKYVSRLGELDVKQVCRGVGRCDGIDTRRGAGRRVSGEPSRIYVCVINVR